MCCDSIPGDTRQACRSLCSLHNYAKPPQPTSVLAGLTTIVKIIAIVVRCFFLMAEVTSELSGEPGLLRVGKLRFQLGALGLTKVRLCSQPQMKAWRLSQRPKVNRCLIEFGEATLRVDGPIGPELSQLLPGTTASLAPHSRGGSGWDILHLVFPEIYN